jgi:MFS family permease
MRAYREILTIPGALKFCAAGLLARSGGAMMGLGIVLMVSALYGSYGLAGALAAANGLAWAVGTAVLSNLVDRYGQRKVMYPSTVVSASMLAVTVVFGLLQLPAWTLFAPIIISGATGGAPGALVRTRWNYVLDDPARLHTAFALESTLDELTFVIGPVAATALAVGVHPVAGLVAPIVLSLIGAKLFYSQRETEPPPHPREATEKTTAAWRRMILLVPGVAAVVAVNVLIGSMFGAIDVSVVAAATSWDARAASGVILAVFSLASGLSGFWFGARTWGGLASKRFLIGVLAMFASSALLPFANTVFLLGAIGMLFGATVAPTLITGNTVLEKLVPTSRLTEGLSWMGTGLGIGVSIGSSVSGSLIDASGYHSGLLAVGVFGVIAAVIALASYRTVRRHAHGDQDAIPGQPAESPTP